MIEGICSSNKILYNFLTEKGYEEKSLEDPYKILDIIPENLKHYWWRGYIDGDGSFYCNKKNHVYRFQISGSYNQKWDSLIKLCENLKVEYHVKKYEKISKLGKIHRYSTLDVRKIDSIQKMGNYIYQNYDYLGLDRKYHKFQSIPKVKHQKQ